MKIALLTMGLVCGLTACSISTTNDSITFKVKTKFIAQPSATKTSSRDWSGDPIQIENANGNVNVIGESGRTKISLETNVFAFADGDKKADADATIADVVASLAIVEDNGRFYIKCAKGNSHGTSESGTSGCENFTVRIPAGAASQGLTLEVIAHNGSLNATGLYAKDGQQLIFTSDNGDVTVSNINGSTKVYTNNGDVSASITPRQGSNLDVSSNLGDVTLFLPSNFSADVLSFQGEQVVISGFSDLTRTSASRGVKGEGASSIRAAVDSSLSTLYIKPQ